MHFQRIKTKPAMPPYFFLRLSAKKNSSLNIVCIQLRYLFSQQPIWRYISWLFYLALPILVAELLSTQNIQAINLMLVSDLCLIPLTYSLAGLIFEFQSLHAPMRALHIVYNINANYLRNLSFITLLAICFILCLSVAIVLYLQNPIWRVMTVPAFGMLAMSGFVLLNFLKINRNTNRDYRFN
jgi:hypothetical protein